MPWLNAAGEVIVDGGAPVLCDECPCPNDPLLCDTWSVQLPGTEVALNLTAGTFSTNPLACDCSWLDDTFIFPLEILTATPFAHYYLLDFPIPDGTGECHGEMDFAVLCNCFGGVVSLSVQVNGLWDDTFSFGTWNWTGGISFPEEDFFTGTPYTIPIEMSGFNYPRPCRPTGPFDAVVTIS